MNGTIKWYNQKKGYGFVKGDDDNDYFVHYSQVPDGVFLKENDPVTFDAVETEKGKQAQNVAEGDASSAPAPEPEEAPVEEPEAETKEATEEPEAETKEATEEPEAETKEATEEPEAEKPAKKEKAKGKPAKKEKKK